MVLPLLGLLGLGVGSMALPYVRNFQGDVERKHSSRIREGILAGIDPDDTDAQSDALFRGGLLDPQQYVAGQQAGDELASLDRYRASTLGLDQQRIGQEQQRIGQAQQRLNLDMLNAVPTPTGPVDMESAFGGLVQMESGGDPTAVSSKGALGLGQIMPANIAPWARELGLAGEGESDDAIMQRYASDDAFQAQLAQGKFGQYVQQYGLRDAYSMWHSGVPLAQAIREGRHDGNMSTADYVMMQMQGYGQRADQKAAEQRQAFTQHAVETVGTPAEQALFDNPFTPPQVQQDITANIVQRAGTIPEAPYNRWTDPQVLREEVTLAREALPQALSLQGDIEEAQTAVEYFRDTSGAERKANPSQTARFDSSLRSTMINYLRGKFEAGALQGEDLRFFDRLVGDPNGSIKLTDADLARSTVILNQAKRELGTMYQTNPLIDPRMPAGEQGPLTPEQTRIARVLSPMRFPTPSVTDDGSRRLEAVPKAGASRPTPAPLSADERRRLEEEASVATGN